MSCDEAYVTPTDNPEDLMCLARAARCKGNLAHACNLLGNACALKREQVSSDICVDLSEFLLEYGDCLLAKEEASFESEVENENYSLNMAFRKNTLEHFEKLVKQRADIRASAKDKIEATSIEDETSSLLSNTSSVDDLQLSWECLESAFHCLMLHSEDSRPSSRIAFCLSRLADSQVLQGKHKEAFEDYLRAGQFLLESDVHGRSENLVKQGECLRQMKNFNSAKEVYIKAKSLLENSEATSELEKINTALEYVTAITENQKFSPGEEKEKHIFDRPSEEAASKQPILIQKNYSQEESTPELMWSAMNDNDKL